MRLLSPPPAFSRFLPCPRASPEERSKAARITIVTMIAIIAIYYTPSAHLCLLFDGRLATISRDVYHRNGRGSPRHEAAPPRHWSLPSARACLIGHRLHLISRPKTPACHAAGSHRATPRLLPARMRSQDARKPGRPRLSQGGRASSASPTPIRARCRGHHYQRRLAAYRAHIISLD